MWTLRRGVLLLVLMTVALTGSCTSGPADPAGDAAPTMSAGEAATPGPSARPTPSRQVEMPVGHCWVEPVLFDGSAWAVVPQDQFGSGGGIPRGWVGQGVMVRLSQSRSRYADRGGHVIRLVPAEEPAAAEVFEQGCD